MGRHSTPDDEQPPSKFLHYEGVATRLPTRWRRALWALRPYILLVYVFTQIAVIGLVLLWAKDPTVCNVT